MSGSGSQRVINVDIRIATKINALVINRVGISRLISALLVRRRRQSQKFVNGRTNVDCGIRDIINPLDDAALSADVAALIFSSKDTDLVLVAFSLHKRTSVFRMDHDGMSSIAAICETFTKRCIDLSIGRSADFQKNALAITLVGESWNFNGAAGRGIASFRTRHEIARRSDERLNDDDGTFTIADSESDGKREERRVAAAVRHLVNAREGVNSIVDRQKSVHNCHGDRSSRSVWVFASSGCAICDSLHCRKLRIQKTARNKLAIHVNVVRVHDTLELQVRVTSVKIDLRFGAGFVGLSANTMSLHWLTSAFRGGNGRHNTLDGSRGAD